MLIHRKMDLSFAVSGIIYRIGLKHIQDYPYKTYISSLLEYQDINVDKDKDGNILIEEYGKYFEYVIYILENKIETMKDLLLHCLNLISDENMPKIFYKDHFDQILLMLDCFGFSSFTLIKIDTSRKAIDKANRKIHEKLQYMNDFLRHNNVHISGSYPLSYLMDTKWNSDVDMYMKYSDLDALLLRHDILIKRKSESNLCMIGRYSDYEYISCKGLQRILSKELEQSIDCVEVTDKHEFDNGYGMVRGLIFCIRFKMNDIKFDLVITRYNPKDSISLFDFDFNKIYYDGYTLSSLSWGSIAKMQSINRYASDRYSPSEECKFKENINRIRKYIERGFILFINTEYPYQSDQLHILP